MTKKIKINFLVLLGFLFLIFSCRTDEITNSQERLAREKIGAFVNFEKNLQSAKNFRTSQKSYSYPFAELIYNFLEKNKDFENDLSQKYGDIDLNVASQTFGDDEKAVVFPILKNGKVIEAIACHVNEERDYVKFRLINDKVMKTTFINAFQNFYIQKALNKNRLSKEAPQRDITEVVITYVKPISSTGSWWIDTSSMFASGSYTGTMDGGSDVHGTPGSQIYTPQTNDPCTKATEQNTNAKKILEDAKIKSKKDSLTKDIKTDVNEKSFSFGKNKEGHYDTTSLKTGTTGNSVGIDATSTILTIEGGAHSHIPSLFDCFSAGDFYAFSGANNANPYFKYYYVFSEDAGYLMAITDPEKFKKFTENFPKSTFFDTSTGDWKKDSTIYNSFDNAYNQFLKSNLDEDLAFEYATAFVMTKYDMGISLSKEDINGNFNSVFIKETQIFVRISPGLTIPISIFEKTDDCNLK